MQDRFAWLSSRNISRLLKYFVSFSYTLLANPACPLLRLLIRLSSYPCPALLHRAEDVGISLVQNGHNTAERYTSARLQQVGFRLIWPVWSMVVVSCLRFRPVLPGHVRKLSGSVSCRAPIPDEVLLPLFWLLQHILLTFPPRSRCSTTPDQTRPSVLHVTHPTRKSFPAAVPSATLLPEYRCTGVLLSIA